MEPATRTLDPGARPNKTLSFPNGALKKHHHIPRPPPPAPPQAADLLYRECLKNHAASLGGHALDGCGEFMPSPAANPADPTSLKCAACGCHRNFHRRLPEPHRHHDGDDEQEGEDEMDGGDEDGQMEEDDGEDDRHRHGSSSSPPPYLSSAPHMLLALSSGGTGLGSNPVRPITPAAAAAPPGMMAGSTSAAVAVLPRKRFRTKFSPEQKEKMQELSERLRWRMQKRDEGLVEEFCRGIGVGKGVFKVWMHNNKHNFIPGSSSRRGEIGSSSSGGGGGGGIEGNSSGAGAGGGDSHVVNGPPS